MGDKVTISWIIFILVALVCVFSLPKIDHALFPSSTGPGAITVFGIGILFTLLTLLLFYSFYKEQSLTSGFLISAVCYSALIILVKFAFGPLSLYEANQTRSFDIMTVNPIAMFFAAVGIFLLYFLVFYIIYRIFKKRAEKAIGTESKPNENKKPRNFLKVFGFVLLIGVLIALGGIPILMLLLFSPLGASIAYLTYIFSTVIGIFMALALVGAILFVCVAFNEVKEQAIKMRDVGLITSFFWIGAAILFAYSALWFVYILIVIAVWPLKTFAPK